MDVDGHSISATSPVMMGMGMSMMGKNERPKMQRSELSEILENVNNSGFGVETVLGARVGEGVGRGSGGGLQPLPMSNLSVVDDGLGGGAVGHSGVGGDADAEGESPGLDALAMAAGAVV